MTLAIGRERVGIGVKEKVVDIPIVRAAKKDDPVYQAVQKLIKARESYFMGVEYYHIDDNVIPGESIFSLLFRRNRK